ncbi:hypothetical protein [Modestobacter sp. URMC 112]
MTSAVPLTQSRLVSELRQVSPRLRGDLRLPAPLLTFWDAVVMTCVVMTDDNDKRPWSDRLGDVLNQILGNPESFDHIDPEFLEALNYFAGTRTVWSSTGPSI